METISFAYDADGMMVLRDNNGQRTIYLGKLYQQELFASGAVKKHYFFGGKLVAMREGGGIRFLLTDHLGSVNVVLDTNGNGRFQPRYNPWGKQRYALNVTPTGYRLTHQPALGQRPGAVSVIRCP